MTKHEDDEIEAGSAEFKTVKAACGIRFDPEVLGEDAGFDFSQAEKFAQENDKDKQDAPLVKYKI